MDRKIRVCAVNYLNTKPLVYGFEKGMMKDEVELSFMYPAKLSAALEKDEVDIGLLPIASLNQAPAYHIISKYGIAANGDVASVCLFSEVPVHEITAIYLDYQSRSSVMLLRILLKDYFKITPELLPAGIGYEKQIKGQTAGLVIGDRALELNKEFEYVYDLAGAWKSLTGLPFVFAAWVANKKLPPAFIENFNRTTGEGLNHLPEIIAGLDFKPYPLADYYTRNIMYILGDEALEGMRVFQEKMKGLTAG